MSKELVIGIFMICIILFILVLRAVIEAKHRSYDGYDDWDSDLCSCGRPRITNHTIAIVWGHEIQLTKSPHCKPCAEQYLEKYATCCETCDQPILPGQLVAIGIDHGRYTHASYDCNPKPGIIAGHWGEGELVEHEYS